MSDAGIIEAAIEAVAERLIDDIHTAMPATVKRYNQDGTINAQPDITTTDNAGNTLQMPVIYKIPVVMPGIGTLKIEAPINIGDKVLLIFAERAIDGWIGKMAQSVETDKRRHSLTDAIAITGLTNAKLEKLKITDNASGATIEFQSNGTININNGALEISK